MMRFLVMMMVSLVCGFENLLLIGPKTDTLPLAKHYARFYNIPVLEQPTCIYPSHYIMVKDERTKEITPSNIRTIDINDYPHVDRHPNYFISWLKQQTSL